MLLDEDMGKNMHGLHVDTTMTISLHFPFWTHFLMLLQWCCFMLMFISTFICFLPHSVFCEPHLTFSSSILSSHLSLSSPTQGHTSHRADLISWEIQVARKDHVWVVVLYVWSNYIAPSHFTHRLDTQMKYILHMTFYQETTLSSNSSELKKWFTP